MPSLSTSKLRLASSRRLARPAAPAGQARAPERARTPPHTVSTRCSLGASAWRRPRHAPTRVGARGGTRGSPPRSPLLFSLLTLCALFAVVSTVAKQSRSAGRSKVCVVREWRRRACRARVPLAAAAGRAYRWQQRVGGTPCCTCCTTADRRLLQVRKAKEAARSLCSQHELRLGPLRATRAINGGVQQRPRRCQTAVEDPSATRAAAAGAPLLPPPPGRLRLPDVNGQCLPWGRLMAWLWRFASRTLTTQSFIWTPPATPRMRLLSSALRLAALACRAAPPAARLAIDALPAPLHTRATPKKRCRLSHSSHGRLRRHASGGQRVPRGARCRPASSGAPRPASGAAPLARLKSAPPCLQLAFFRISARRQRPLHPSAT